MRKYINTLAILKIITLIVFWTLLIVAAANAQPSTMRAAYQAVVSTTPANGGTYAAIGFFLDSDGLGYTEADIRVDTTMLLDARGYKYRVVYSSGGSPLTLEYNLIEGSGDMDLGYVTIGDPINFDLTENIMPETGAQIPDKSRASNETRFRQQILIKIGSVQANSGSPKDTVTTTTTVYPGLPVHFNGSTWEIAYRSSSKFAWGLVVDTISGTNAIIQSIGLANIPSHGFTVGQYYSLGNGSAVLSSSIDSTMYDQWLFNVLDSNTLDVKLSAPVEPPGSSIGGGGSEVNDLSSVVTWTTIPDLYISASSVLQHVEDDVYGVSWNGDLGPATKNAIYDKIELISAGGEVNTASSVGSGTSIFKQKTGVDLEFNAIKSENALLAVALDAGTNDVELTVQPNLSNYTNDAGFITATLTQEQVEDYVGALIRGLGPITVTYDDAGDSLLISSVFSPGLTNHAVSGATHTIDLGSYRDGIHQIDCISASSPLTLTINNPIDQGVYTFHALNTSSTDIVYPANFFFMAGGGSVGTVSYAQDDGMTCYYDAANNKYYCK